MDHPISWRVRPPPPQMQGNNICPICLISHFPFCPPHPPFHENPRSFQSHFSQTPQFDHRPYPYPPPPPPPYIPPPVDNLYPVHGFGDRFPRPNFPSYDHGNVGVKRMRADENHPNYSNFVSEDERRLKSLIRDHGNVSAAGLPSANYENNGYMHENSGLRRNFNEIDEGEHRIMDKAPLKLNTNGEMYEFSNPCVDYIEKGPYSPLEHYRDGKGIGSVQGYGHDADNVGKGRVPYKSDFTDSSSSVPERVDVKWPSLDAQRMHYSFPGAPNESCLSNDIKRTNPGGSISMKETHQSYGTNWHGVMQGSVNEQRSNQPPNSYRMLQHPEHENHHARQSFGVNVHSENGFSSSSGTRNFNKGVYPPMYNRANAGAAPRVYDVQPPLPTSPPPPLPMESGHSYPKPFDSSSSSIASSTLFPISVSSSMDVPLSYPSAAEAHSLTQTRHTDHPDRHISRGVSEDFLSHQASFKEYSREQQTIQLRPIVPDKPKIVDGSQIFKQPHRATRPDHIVIILRGLPGSGKSYLAKMLRDIEVENGGDAPRIHSMDDYFMTEVEKVEDTESSKSSGSIRSRKPVMKKVMEYCYEPEMEEAYRSSMLKAFKKTLDEGVFSFIIVDDRNLRVAEFAQFWATAKRSGFEVYLLEASYKDPAGCAARNVHGFSKDDIQNMAGQWEEASAMYLKLDIKSLLNGDDLEDSGIQEVDMDMEDDDPAGGLTRSEEIKPEDPSAPLDRDIKSSGPAEDDERLDKKDHPTDEVKELTRSKWSDNFDEGDTQRSESVKSNSSSLSGLISAYSKQGKSVHWGDKAGNMGFSIGAANKAKVVSLVIGPGAGYNLKSNPLTEQDNLPSARKNVELQRQNIFQEQLRAERESFKAIFEKRKQRIGGLGTEEDRL